VKTYEPHPIDTARVVLPASLDGLIEGLAASTHDHWAAKRMADGWTYGERRDDATKQHPDLVAYDELTESEKEYDRVTVTETLKAITALGYKISR